MAADASIAQYVANEAAILKTRVDALELVTNGPPSKLQSHLMAIKDAQKPRDGGAGAGASSAAAGRARLGTAPPCRSYLDLVTLCSFDPVTEQITDATSKEEIVQITKNLKDSSRPVSELVGMVKSAIRQTKTCVTKELKDLEQLRQTEKKKQQLPEAKGSWCGEGAFAVVGARCVHCETDRVRDVRGPHSGRCLGHGHRTAHHPLPPRRCQALRGGWRDRPADEGVLGEVQEEQPLFGQGARAEELACGDQ